jgi:FixJ family two-component response regulator
VAADPRLTIALVDDDDDVRTAVSRLLRSMGHEVRVYRSAEAFEAEPIAADCAIVDLRLPGMSGLELRGRLRARKVTLPIVLITGDGYRLDRDLSSIADTPLLTKPFDGDSLTAAIATAMGIGKTGS